MLLQGRPSSTMKFLVFFLLSSTVFAAPGRKQGKKACPMYPKVVVDKTDCEVEIRDLSKVEKFKLGVDQAQKLECLCNVRIKFLSQDGKTEIGSADRVMTAEITVYGEGEEKFVTVALDHTWNLKVPNPDMEPNVVKSVVDHIKNTPDEALKQAASAAIQNHPDLQPDLYPLLGEHQGQN